MDEKEILEGTIPEVSENAETDKVKATIPDTEPEPNEDRKVTVKFNKETRDLSYDEAVTLAQKGMKYESIEEEYSRLKSIAKAKGKGIKEYIDSLEGTNDGDLGLEELRENFPEIKTAEDIPEAVLAAVQERGGNLLDAYLRYRLSEERQAKEVRIKQRQNQNISVGSQRSSNNSLNEINDEFIKGLWN